MNPGYSFLLFLAVLFVVSYAVLYFRNHVKNKPIEQLQDSNHSPISGTITVGELIDNLSDYDDNLLVHIRDVGLDLGNVPVLRQSYASPKSPTYLDGKTVVILAGEN